MNDERFINNMVLRFFDELRGIPQTREEVSNHVQGRLRRPADASVDRALAYLESAEYLRRAGAAVDAELFVITDKGTKQIKRMVPRADLDAMIWEN